MLIGNVQINFGVMWNFHVIFFLSSIYLVDNWEMLNLNTKVNTDYIVS